MEARIYTKEIMDQVYEKDGWLYWNISKRKIQKHSLVGTLHHTGYYVAKINGKMYMNHRILYQIYHNIILKETDVIDHHDKNKQNNSKENLWLCNKKENNCNRKTGKNNLSTGLKNISLKKYKNVEYYHLRIKLNNVEYSKYFRTDKFTEREVIEFRDKKLKEIHGDFMSIG